MSALSSNDQITELHKMYKMDHCYCTPEIIVYIYEPKDFSVAK